MNEEKKNELVKPLFEEGDSQKFAFGGGQMGAENGRRLVENALARYRGDQTNKVLEAVKDEILLRDQALLAIENNKKQVLYYTKVLAALEAGDFRVTPDGRFVFNDEDLRLGHHNP